MTHALQYRSRALSKIDKLRYRQADVHLSCRQVYLAIVDKISESDIIEITLVHITYINVNYFDGFQNRPILAISPKPHAIRNLRRCDIWTMARKSAEMTNVNSKGKYS